MFICISATLKSYYSFKLFGQFGLQDDLLLCIRMDEGDVLTMQRLTINQLKAPAVQIVACKRMPDMAHMTAYLVSTACFDNDVA